MSLKYTPPSCLLAIQSYGVTDKRMENIYLYAINELNGDLKEHRENRPREKDDRPYNIYIYIHVGSVIYHCETTPRRLH